MFGEASQLEGTRQALAVLVVVLAALAMVRLQAGGLALRARERERRSRAASTLRDLVNFLGVFVLWAALVFAGHPPAAALLFAGTLSVVVDVLAHTVKAPRRLPAAATVALAAGVALTVAASAAVELANDIAGAVFSGL